MLNRQRALSTRLSTVYESIAELSKEQLEVHAKSIDIQEKIIRRDQYKELLRVRAKKRQRLAAEEKLEQHLQEVVAAADIKDDDAFEDVSGAVDIGTGADSQVADNRVFLVRNLSLRYVSNMYDSLGLFVILYDYKCFSLCLRCSCLSCILRTSTET